MGTTATFSLTRALRWARGSALLFTLAVMAVTMTLAVAVNALRDETDQRHTAQLLLRELEADAAELQIAEVAAADGDPTALVEFAQERADMWRTFIALAELVSTDQVAVEVVNDSFGHAAGDRMLVTTAERISSCLRLEDTVARFGGDEFAVLLENVADEAEAATTARRILDRLASEPALLQDGRRVYTTASIGIALGKPSVDDPSTVLRAADLAMYGAKATGKGSWTTFRLGMEQRASDRLMLEIDLRGALERGEFEVQFQPQVDLEQGHVVGVEALLRWHHPKRGVILPSEFIPIAEQSG